MFLKTLENLFLLKYYNFMGAKQSKVSNPRLNVLTSVGQGKLKTFQHLFLI